MKCHEILYSRLGTQIICRFSHPFNFITEHLNILLEFEMLLFLNHMNARKQIRFDNITYQQFGQKRERDQNLSKPQLNNKDRTLN